MKNNSTETKIQDQVDKAFSQKFLHQIAFNQIKPASSQTQVAWSTKVNNSFTTAGHGPFVKLNDESVKYNLYYGDLLGQNHPLKLRKETEAEFNINSQENWNEAFKEFLYAQAELNEYPYFYVTKETLGAQHDITELANFGLQSELFQNALKDGPSSFSFELPFSSKVILSKHKLELKESLLTKYDFQVLRLLCRGNFYGDNGKVLSMNKEFLKLMTKQERFHGEGLVFSYTPSEKQDMKRLINSIFNAGIIAGLEDERIVFKLPLCLTTEHVTDISKILLEELSKN